MHNLPSVSHPRWAMFVAPHLGGIFSFYLGLRNVLKDRLYSVELAGESVRWRDYMSELAGAEHSILPVRFDQNKEASKHVTEWLVQNQISVVLVTPMTPSVVFDAIPHLPKEIRVITRLTELSEHSYKRALRKKTTLDGIIVQSRRQESEVSIFSGELPRYLLSNAVDTARFHPASEPTENGPLRLLFLDRLVDLQKRVFLLPDICKELDARNVHYKMTIAGDGPNRDVLHERLTPWLASGRVVMPGSVPSSKVPQLMRDHDIYIKLSPREGSPNSVYEALATGLVTVAGEICGVMENIITDGRSGYIVPSGDTRAVVDRIARLDADRGRLRTMAQQARTAAVESHSIDRFAERVAQIEAALPELSRREPKPWSDWTSSEPKPSSLRRHLRRALPLAWRIRAREWLGRLR